jgi:hypothetical protein
MKISLGSQIQNPLKQLLFQTNSIVTYAIIFLGSRSNALMT